MEVFINNRLAAIKQGTSFEYVAENRLFSGSDAYTLSIVFPLRDCPQNLEIFGHINRSDVAALKVVFDCEIRHGAFAKFGTVVVTEINEAEVKAQFLEGRSEQNFNVTFDDVFINELSLGSGPFTSPSMVTPIQARDPEFTARKCVALPWVKNSSDGLEHNFSEPHLYSSWSTTTKDVSWFPYLIYIAKQICIVCGYSFDFGQWERNEFLSRLLVCNVLPYSWGLTDFGRALPHWSVAEFFEKLELLLDGEFDINHRAKHISFRFSSAAVELAGIVVLDEVVEEFATEVTVEDVKCEFLGVKNIVYKSQSHELWKYQSCDWLIKSRGKGAAWHDTIEQFKASVADYLIYTGTMLDYSYISVLHYVKEVDSYFMLRTVKREDAGVNAYGYKLYRYFQQIQLVNGLGGRIVDDSDDAPKVELDFVPAHINYHSERYGLCLFVDIGNFDEESGDEKFSPLENLIRNGQESKKAEYFSSISLGYWDGVKRINMSLPFPVVESPCFLPDGSEYFVSNFSLALRGSRTYAPIEPSKKTTFKFLATSVPDVRAIFLINGKRYICEKITATFTEFGMSQLLKGVFYPLKD